MLAVSMDLFTCAADNITFDAVHRFVTTAIEEKLQAESLVLEFKAQNDGNNIAKAVAAMANTDGGIIVVGVDESAENPIVGIPKGRQDAIVSSLRTRVPDAMPDVIPVAMPGGEGILLVLRVDADSAIHPVVLDGKVYKRIPGQSVGARRDEIVALCNRPTSLSAASFGDYQGGLLDLQMWDDDESVATAEVRSRARFMLPRRFETRRYLGSEVMAAIDATLQESPLPDDVLAEHVLRRERTQTWWDRTTTSSLRVDFTARPSSMGQRWRPGVEARSRVVLQHRTLESTVAIRLTPQDGGPPPVLDRVGDVHEVVLAASWVAVAAGRACFEALRAGPAQVPALDAAVRHVFSSGALSLGMRRTIVETAAQRQPVFTFPTFVPDSASIMAIDAVVKDWLHVPLFEFGMIDFEQDLAGLALQRWARSLEDPLTQ